MARFGKFSAALGFVLAVVAAPAAPAHAVVDDVHAGPVSVERYECDPTASGTAKDPCPQPARCTVEAVGDSCRRVCVDDPLAFGACVWQTPGGFVGGVDGACVEYLGDPLRACVNGFDGCLAQGPGVRLHPNGEC